MPYTTIISPVYKEKPHFGYAASNTCGSIRYQFLKKNKIQTIGVDLTRSSIITDLPPNATTKANPGYVITIDYLVGKNLLEENRKFYFIPQLGLGLQYNNSKGIFWGIGIGLDPFYYRFISLNGTNRNLIQPIVDAGFDMGFKTSRNRRIGLHVKAKYAHFITSTETFEYYALQSPEPNLVRKAVHATTGSGLEIVFYFGLPIKKNRT